MKHLFRLLIFLFVLVVGSSFMIPTCRCRPLTFEEEVANADQIFTGKVISKVAGDWVTYTFVLSRSFKGVRTDTVAIQTGRGGGDCGALFTVGESYLIYARDGRTNACRRNALVQKTGDVEALAKLFTTGKTAQTSHVGLKQDYDSGSVLLNAFATLRNVELAGYEKEMIGDHEEDE